MDLDQTVSQFLLLTTTAIGAVVASMWLGLVLWTWRDMRARSRDVMAQGAATLVVAILNVFGLIIYLMLRPRETLTEAYERSLEEESLLQGIEEKPVCPGCGRPTNILWQVCPYCHTRLKKPCVQCGQLLELNWNLCPYCATLQATPDVEARGRGQGRVRRTAPGSSRRPAEAPPSARETPDQSMQQPTASLEFIDGDDV